MFRTWRTAKSTALSRDAIVFAKRQELISRFLTDLDELYGGDCNAVTAACGSTLLSVLTHIHRGNKKSVALNVEQLAEQIAESVRDGEFDMTFEEEPL